MLKKIGFALTALSAAASTASATPQHVQRDTLHWAKFTDSLYGPGYKAFGLYRTLLTQHQDAYTAQLKRFRYQAQTGECRNGLWEKGYNAFDEDALFGHPVELTDGYRVFLGQDAECVDFGDFDFFTINNKYKFTYLPLVNWNLKGARVGPDASLFFVNISQAQLQGASMPGGGYITYSDSQVDSYSVILTPELCKPNQQGLINCFR